MSAIIHQSARVSSKDLRTKGVEKLPSGSIVYWSEADHRGRVPVVCGKCGYKRGVEFRGGRTGFCRSCRRETILKDETLDTSGSIIHWSEQTKKLVPVTCSKCNFKRTLLIVSVEQGKKGNYTGHCVGCRNRKNYSDKVIESTGSIIHWSRREPSKPKDRIWITCGRCKETRLSPFPDAQAIEAGKFTGLCSSCSHNERTTDEKYINGTIVHWGERIHGTHRNTIVAVTCSGCSQKKFISPTTINGPNWPALCSSCRPEWRGQNKLIEDETLNPWVSIIHWSESDDLQVPVTCGFCKKTRIDRRSTIIQRHKNPDWNATCRSHQFKDRLRFAAWLVDRAGAPDSNGERKNRSAEKRRRGRKLGSTTVDPEKTMTMLTETVLTLKSEGRTRSSVTANLVAHILHIGSSESGGDTLMKKLKRHCKVDVSWPELRDSIWDGKVTISAGNNLLQEAASG